MPLKNCEKDDSSEENVIDQQVVCRHRVPLNENVNLHLHFCQVYSWKQERGEHAAKEPCTAAGAQPGFAAETVKSSYRSTGPARDPGRNHSPHRPSCWSLARLGLPS